MTVSLRGGLKFGRLLTCWARFSGTFSVAKVALSFGVGSHLLKVFLLFLLLFFLIFLLLSTTYSFWDELIWWILLIACSLRVLDWFFVVVCHMLPVVQTKFIFLLNVKVNVLWFFILSWYVGSLIVDGKWPFCWSFLYHRTLHLLFHLLVLLLGRLSPVFEFVILLFGLSRNSGRGSIEDWFSWIFASITQPFFRPRYIM